MGRPPAGEAPQPDKFKKVDPQRALERRGQYEVLATAEIHNRFGMTVESHFIRMPGKEEIKEILSVRFPNEATLMALTVNGSIMGSREKVYGTDENNFEFSGGVKGEGTIEEAAMRRVQEEIGVTPRAASVKSLSAVRSDSPFLWNVTHQSVAAVETMEESPEHPTIKRELIPAENARSMVLNGEINTANIALQALLIADRLEADGRDMPLVETRIMPGGRWIDQKPSSWKLVELAAQEGQPVAERGGLEVLERTIKHETESGDAQLIHDRIRRPDGSEGDQYFLTYSRQLQVIPVDENGKAYLKKEHSYAYNEEIFALPNTNIAEGETYGQAAQRIASQAYDLDIDPASMYDLNEWGETTSRMDYKTRLVAVPVQADTMAARKDMIAVDIAEGWQAVKTGTEIDGKRIDTLTPALALGLLRHTQLQAA